MSPKSQYALRTIEAARENAFEAEVVACFSSRPRSLSPRWLYDQRGSELFEAITALPEYYVTRAEHSILSRHAAAMAPMIGAGRALVELGSGSSLKTTLLLAALAPSAYVPVDICGDFLHQSVAGLAARFPALAIHPVVADFMEPYALPRSVSKVAKVCYFAGSTIGNMTVPVAVEFLRRTARLLGERSLLLIGIDRIKDPERLIAAYDDSRGVTAQFNLNVLHRMNRELEGTIPVAAFRHVARWNDYEARIEMHLEAAYDVEFTVAGDTFSMAKGETIHTENSLKYDRRGAQTLLRAGGWSPIAEWTDEEGFFSVFLASSCLRPVLAASTTQAWEM